VDCQAVRTWEADTKVSKEETASISHGSTVSIILSVPTAGPVQYSQQSYYKHTRMFVRYQVLTAASMEFRVFRDVLPCGYCIRAMMDAARTSETSVDIEFRTRQYIPEDSELRTRKLLTLKLCCKMMHCCGSRLKRYEHVPIGASDHNFLRVSLIYFRCNLSLCNTILNLTVHPQC
jgi:hypothetical protein